jgi:hypothetical protein
MLIKSVNKFLNFVRLMREPRVGLGSPRWQREILPLNYSRIKITANHHLKKLA